MGLSARPARSDDHALFSRFFAAFEVPDPIPDQAWWNRVHEDAFFFEEAGTAVGYGLAYKLVTAGHVMHVSVDATARNRGIGRAIMRTLAQKLRARGCTRWTLDVKEDNAPALALYRRCGMEVEFGVASMSVPWTAVARLPSCSTIVETFAPEGDHAVEAAFDLEAGRVGRQREHPGRVLLRARSGTEISGVIAFNPAFATAPLFRARSLAVGRALFDGIRPHALPEQDCFRVIVEANEELAAEIERAGATRVVSLVHMAGEIPGDDELNRLG